MILLSKGNIPNYVSVPPKVKGVYVRKIDGIVEWLPTDSVNGMITKYQVQLFSSDTYGRTIDVDKSTVLYQVNVSKDFPVSGQPVSVRVSNNNFSHFVNVLYTIKLNTQKFCNFWEFMMHTKFCFRKNFYSI